MITIFNKRRKQAEYSLQLLENQNKQLLRERSELMDDCRRMKAKLKVNYIKNVPNTPKWVTIKWHTGNTKTVFFDGKNFLKSDGSPYRLGSIKCWYNESL